MTSSAFALGRLDYVPSSVTANTIKITGSAQQLTSTSIPTSRVTIFNRSAYGVWVGDSSIVKKQRYLLNPGSATTGNTVTIEIGNLKDIYIVGSPFAGLELVSYLAEKQ